MKKKTDLDKAIAEVKRLMKPGSFVYIEKR